MQTLATRITLLRIVFTPVFVILLISDLPLKNWLAAAAFGLIAISDGLDGYLARSLNQVTDFGKFLDPIADKLVIAAALVVLVQVAGLPVWAAVIIITREIVISIFRVIYARRNIVISASNLGKAKTFTQIAAIFFWIFNAQSPSFINNLSWLVLIAAVILSVASGFDYLLRYRKAWIKI